MAESSSVPVILYNVPSRTGVNLTIEQLKILAERENIVAIKEAGDSMDRYVSLSTLSDRLTLYAGNDSQIYVNLALGGLGVISVLSNLYPRLAVEIYESYKAKDLKRSLLLQGKTQPLINALFAETNPAPVKYAMNKIGLCENQLRLPLAPVTKATEEMIVSAPIILTDYPVSL